MEGKQTSSVQAQSMAEGSEQAVLASEALLGPADTVPLRHHPKSSRSAVAVLRSKRSLIAKYTRGVK
jgi:hypothetical protein